MNVDTVAGDTAPSAAVLNARPLRNEESASWELEDGLAVITHCGAPNRAIRRCVSR